MADFCYDCTNFASGSTIPEDEIWKVLCEGCGVIHVDSDGKKVHDIYPMFCEKIDEEIEDE